MAGGSILSDVDYFGLGCVSDCVIDPRVMRCVLTW